MLIREADITRFRVLCLIFGVYIMARIALSLRFRLLLVIIAAVLPALALNVVTAQEDRKREMAEAQANALEITRLIAVQEENLFDGTRQLLITAVQAGEIRDGNPEQCSLFLGRLLMNFRRYDNFGLADMRGDVLCSALPLTRPVNIADRSYFQQALQSQEFAVGDFQVGRITGKPSINFGYPVADQAGNIQAVVFAAMDVKRLSELEAEVAARLPVHATLTKVDGNGIVLSRIPDPEMHIGRLAPEFHILGNVVSQENGVIQTTDPQGRLMLYSFARLPSVLYRADLYVIVDIPEEVAFAEINGTFNRNLTLLGIAAALLLVGAFIGNEFILMRPIRALSAATTRITQGNLNARSPQVSLASTELKHLSAAFNQMAESLQERDRELANAYDATLEGWVHALDLRDKETEGHTQRVSEMTVHLAHAMGISESDIIHIRRGALLHDIGKIGIPDEILLKTDALTGNEWEIMRKHPVYAFEMLFPIIYLRPALDIPYCHHEKWNGTGYPRGLRGEDIPLPARMFAVVDVWDALSNDRHYRAAWPFTKVREYILSQSGIHFDAQAVEVFLKVVSNQ